MVATAALAESSPRLALVGHRRDEEPDETLVLKNGDTLRGTSQSLESGRLHWQLQSGSIWIIPLSDIARIERWDHAGAIGSQSSQNPKDRENTPQTDDTQSGDATGTTGFTAASGEPLFLRRFPLAQRLESLYDNTMQLASTWTRRVQVGGQFNDGNTKTDLIDVFSDYERSTLENTRLIELGGQWGRAASKTTANRWWLNTNFDRPIVDSWITFFTTKNEYNDLANLDYRGTASTGIGYRFLNQEKKRLITRFGPAFTIEVFQAAPWYRTSPDMFAELEVRWPLFDRTSFEHKIRVQPNILDYELVRVFSNTGLLIDLDEKDRWKLRLGLRYEYISQPSSGRQPADYFSTLSLVYVRK